MEHLKRNAIEFLQRRLPKATVVFKDYYFSSDDGLIRGKFSTLIAQDMNAGVKQRAVVVENFGKNGEIKYIAESIDGMFDVLDKEIIVGMSVASGSASRIDSVQMTYAPRILFYTNQAFVPADEIVRFFDGMNKIVDIVEEGKMHKSIFISFGGPDQDFVSDINKRIKSKGVKTWFFPEDSLPGDKLHRVMHDGVNNHDRVLLVCSRSSLTRFGVLNEIERVLEREAREGGASILIPITLDDFVFSDWAPDRKDLAAQVRSRVIVRVDQGDEERIEQQIAKIIGVLRS